MKENIALIGFMGSGKTTVGRALAKALEMKFVDIDKEIVKLEKRSVAEIFQENGEEYFRELERKIIDKESRDNNIVISTGGGVIIDNENIKKLKNTSFVVYLNCDIDCIFERVKNKKHRPLLNVDDPYKKIVELYNKREILYKISCDFSVDINSNSYLYDTVEKIKNKYINS
ncbi:shikimate kinase [Fusobacterium perfoetens]|uniref:shikimate kinase n=1 Tax=Fusobacterium perfoetens TaxID=852 RepID=UPI0004893D49|nr:shikimate kinase [Fusobacterium perfoetens]MCI6152450.1 shikimate kinase [Fusobacterium perfoetens]MDY3237049.1 shikimate kinase [Fusobacterium perfoetens]